MIRIFIEFPLFRVAWKELGLTDRPAQVAGEMIGKSQSGQRYTGYWWHPKLRFAFENRGKKEDCHASTISDTFHTIPNHR